MPARRTAPASDRRSRTRRRRVDSHKTTRPFGPGMFHEQRTSVPDDVDALRAEYAADLAAAVESVGVERAVERTDLDRAVVERVADGDVDDLSVEDAAAVQALAEGVPDAATVIEMACDHLLLGMSTAVLDVDRLAAGVDLDLDPKEVQQKLERRAPMEFEEFVALQHHVVSEQ